MTRVAVIAFFVWVLVGTVACTRRATSTELSDYLQESDLALVTAGFVPGGAGAARRFELYEGPRPWPEIRNAVEGTASKNGWRMTEPFVGPSDAVVVLQRKDTCAAVIDYASEYPTADTIRRIGLDDGGSALPAIEGTGVLVTFGPCDY